MTAAALWSYVRLGSFDDWLSTHRAGLAAATSDGDERAAAWMLNGIGNHGVRTGQPTGAIHYFRRALEIHRRKTGREAELSLAIGLRIRGDVLRKARRPAEAAEAYRRAVALQKQLGDVYGESLTLVGLGDAHADQGALAEAGACWERALPAFERAGDSGRARGVRGRLERLPEAS
ncbi:tetratricopeptide repeat protein [Streptomyces sp. ISL-43]|uniref:tetratricopeptide repeat protein n=1 Tax=Streptomyces sp. ISL-43 TaxID=2819183 RepID=UPI001BEC476A|nr:tetratricopeptide repeat protein [Streptomyces sp. ISL-43]MBT2447667.1 tetratricopeptide repeat protein [Streptomyces sp. ISL-43]